MAVEEIFTRSFSQLFYPHSTAPVDYFRLLLQAGIDVCGDVPNVILQLLIAGLQ